MACFNPRTRVGCDLSYPHQIPTTTVSIHAPAWGATFTSNRGFTTCSSFNPRTRVGCDTEVFRTLEAGISFNPRTRVGCDEIHIWSAQCTATFQSTHPRGVRPGGVPPRGSLQKVSIHAPAWGATHALVMAMRAMVAFQSTHPRGVRQLSRQDPANTNPFQSTHPRGVRRYRWCFWPIKMAVSIHAPAWGATEPSPLTHLREVVSIHAPAWGATIRASDARLQRPVSIHAPAWGATITLVSLLVFLTLFQSTHPRGVRRILREFFLRLIVVSIHAPAWGATNALTLRPATPVGFNPRTRVGCDGSNLRP